MKRSQESRAKRIRAATSGPVTRFARNRHGFAAYRVRDVMRTPVTTSSTATLAEAEHVLEERHFNLLPVVDGGRFVGVLSKLDLIKGFVSTDGSAIPPYAEIMQRPVARYMNADPFIVDPEMPLTRALETMIATHCKSLPVVRRDGKIVGIVAREDVMRAIRCAVAGGGHDAVRCPPYRAGRVARQR